MGDHALRLSGDRGGGDAAAPSPPPPSSRAPPLGCPFPLHLRRPPHPASHLRARAARAGLMWRWRRTAPTRRRPQPGCPARSGVSATASRRPSLAPSLMRPWLSPRLPPLPFPSLIPCSAGRTAPLHHLPHSAMAPAAGLAAVVVGPRLRPRGGWTCGSGVGRDLLAACLAGRAGAAACLGSLAVRPFLWCSWSSQIPGFSPLCACAGRAPGGGGAAAPCCRSMRGNPSLPPRFPK
nr:homeobox protein engrailed-1-like [Aegilops tauschii subsp. strangulata]